MYIVYLGGTPSNNTFMSLTASILSIVAALLAWFIQNKSSDCIVIEYNLEMNKLHHSALSDEEKKIILQNKERKKSLRRGLCQSLKIQETQIEFGFVTVTSNGFRMKVIQYIFSNEFQSNPDDNTKGNYNDDDGAEYIEFAKILYRHNDKSVNEAFVNHFSFDIDDFEVLFMNKFGFQQSEIELQQIDDNKTAMSEQRRIAMNLAEEISTLLYQNKSQTEIKNELIQRGYDQKAVVSVLAAFQVQHFLFLFIYLF